MKSANWKLRRAASTAGRSCQAVEERRVMAAVRAWRSGARDLEMVVKTWRPMTTISTGVRARTEAVRGRLLISAASPKKLPAPSVAMTSPAGCPGVARTISTLALLDDVKARRRLALLDDVVPGLEVGVRNALGDIGADATEIPRENQQPRPVEADLEAARERRQFEEVNAAPDEPRKETRELEAEHLGHGAVAADRAELAEDLEREGPRRLAREGADDVVGALPALALRELAGGRRGLLVVRVDDVGAVADGPGVGPAAQAHVGRGEDAALFLRRVEPVHHRGRGAADGADDGAAAHEAVLQPHAFAGGEHDAGVELHGDAGLFHLVPGKLAQRRADLGQQLVARMDERHADVVLARCCRRSAGWSGPGR
jgi:hypothetical protein